MTARPLISIDFEVQPDDVDWSVRVAHVLKAARRQRLKCVGYRADPDELCPTANDPARGPTPALTGDRP